MSNKTRRMSQRASQPAQTKEKGVSYIAFESALARYDRVNKRLWLSTLGLIGLLAGSNVAWVIHVLV